MTLLEKLTSADVVCNDCGLRYGKYSVGCSSRWVSECDVCGERKGVTEVRDYGYLQKGIDEARKATKDSIFDDILWDNEKSVEDPADLASYEEGDLICKFTEAEITSLATFLDDYGNNCPPGKDVNFDSVSEKIYELYGDYCVKYELSPALKAYYEKYGTYGTENEAEVSRWEGFRDAFNILNDK